MPARAGCSTPDYPAFTLAQHAAIATWSGARPFGLQARVIADDPDFLELAEVSQCAPQRLRYVIHPTDSGTVVLSRASGGEWELPTIERALTRLSMLEECSGPS